MSAYFHSPLGSLYSLTGLGPAIVGGGQSGLGSSGYYSGGLQGIGNAYQQQMLAQLQGQAAYNTYGNAAMNALQSAYCGASVVAAEPEEALEVEWWRLRNKTEKFLSEWRAELVKAGALRA